MPKSSSNVFCLIVKLFSIDWIYWYTGYKSNLFLENKNYKVGKFPFLANSRAKVNNETDGFVKILADAKDYYTNVQTKDVKYIPFITANDPPAIHLNKEIMDKYRSRMKPFYYQPEKYGTYLEQLGVAYPTVKKP